MSMGDRVDGTDSPDSRELGGSPDPEVIRSIANELYSGIGQLSSGPDGAQLHAGQPEQLAARMVEHLRSLQPGVQGETEALASFGSAMGSGSAECFATGEIDFRDFLAARQSPVTASLHRRLSLQRLYFLPESAASVDPAAAPAAEPGLGSFDVEAVRREFPALHQTVHGKPLIWLDSAATSQKPRAVIDALARFYERDNSNVHRGAHALAKRATEAYEGAREKVRRFLGARSEREIVFVRGTTEAINLVAQSYGSKYVGPGDEIVLTTLEHHSNIVPWQLLCQEKGAVLRVAPINDRGEIVLEEYERLLGPRTRLVAVSQVSNVLGTVVPIQAMTAMAHRVGARVLIDGAQAIPHFGVDVRALDCDFYAFSGHKLFGPSGVGVLYGKEELLDAMPPWQGGGSMIRTVSFEETTYNEIPYKFEAGTPIIGGAVGLGAAIDFLERIGFRAAAPYEEELTAYGSQELARIPGLRLIGTAPHKVSVLSFVLEGVRSEDVGTFLDREGIAVRAGHHCAQPTMKRFNVPSTVRPSLALYNTRREIDTLVAAVVRAKKTLA